MERNIMWHQTVVLRRTLSDGITADKHGCLDKCVMTKKQTFFSKHQQLMHDY
ncbi:hypothetical protein SXCC_03657 [Gluconacetobacter sp. SXCC-1]|nr:hypothetical protein SXCC_03657 [Gluconacetobacter sp. SXCC-1]